MPLRKRSLAQRIARGLGAAAPYVHDYFAQQGSEDRALEQFQQQLALAGLDPALAEDLAGLAGEVQSRDESSTLAGKLADFGKNLGSDDDKAVADFQMEGATGGQLAPFMGEMLERGGATVPYQNRLEGAGDPERTEIEGTDPETGSVYADFASPKKAVPDLFAARMETRGDLPAGLPDDELSADQQGLVDDERGQYTQEREGSAQTIEQLGEYLSSARTTPNRERHAELQRQISSALENVREQDRGHPLVKQAEEFVGRGTGLPGTRESITPIGPLDGLPGGEGFVKLVQGMQQDVMQSDGYQEFTNYGNAALNAQKLKEQVDQLLASGQTQGVPQLDNQIATIIARALESGRLTEGDIQRNLGGEGRAFVDRVQAFYRGQVEGVRLLPQERESAIEMLNTRFLEVGVPLLQQQIDLRKATLEGLPPALQERLDAAFSLEGFIQTMGQGSPQDGQDGAPGSSGLDPELEAILRRQ